MESSKSLSELLAQGGWAMYPLSGLSMILLTLAFWIFWKTTKKNFFGKGDTDEQSLLARISKEMSEGNEDDYEQALEREEGDLLQWIQYTNVVATVAPMVGLLGTVSGMIGAFQTIAGGGMGKPELLAGDIGEALITTATGLVVGIPAMIAYFGLKHRLSLRMSQLENRLKASV